MQWRREEFKKLEPDLSTAEQALLDKAALDLQAQNERCDTLLSRYKAWQTLELEKYLEE